MSNCSMRSIARGCAIVATCLAACGDPLVTADDRGDPLLFALHGEVLDTADPPLQAEDLEVAVVFLRDVFRRNELISTLQIEVIPGTVEGDFPAEFRVTLADSPTVYSWEEDLIYLNLDGTAATGVFTVGHAPDGVRIGQLAIGPRAELDALPTEIDIALNQRTMGPALAPYLPSTTITSYQVIYAEGVGPGDVIYPTRVPATDGEITGGQPIADGFTLVDARTYFEATIWQECANGLLLPVYDKPEYAACLAENANLVSCNDECAQNHANTPEEYDACLADCAATYPDELDRNGCLFEVAQPDIDALCGPEKTPSPDQLRILDPRDALSVTLGADDIKAGLWFLHATPVGDAEP
jgi:hypothetical protein